MARDGFNVARVLRRVAQNSPQPVHRRIQAVFEIDEDARGPDAVHKFFSADGHTRILKQGFQDAERLILNAEAYSMLPQIRSFNVQFERAESENSAERPRHSEESLALQRTRFLLFEIPRDMNLT